MIVSRGLSFAIACLMSLPLSVAAQEPRPAPALDEAAIEERRHELITRLNLSDEQVEAVMPILDDSRERMQALTASYRERGERPSRSEMREMRGEMQAIRDETRTALARHLTPEQLEAYDELQGERRQSFRERMRERRSL